MSDVLVVYYSRTGKTRMVAERLSKLLAADIEEITEKKDRSGALGFIGAGKDTLLKRGCELAHAPDPKQYRLVLIGMPIWAFQPPAPVRSYLQMVDLSGKTVCAFCTSDGSRGKRTFNALNGLLPAPLAATFEWVKPRADDPRLDEALKVWAEEVRAIEERRRAPRE